MPKNPVHDLHDFLHRFFYFRPATADVQTAIARMYDLEPENTDAVLGKIRHLSRLPVKSRQVVEAVLGNRDLAEQNCGPWYDSSIHLLRGLCPEANIKNLKGRVTGDALLALKTSGDFVFSHQLHLNDEEAGGLLERIEDLRHELEDLDLDEELLELINRCLDELQSAVLDHYYKITVRGEELSSIAWRLYQLARTLHERSTPDKVMAFVRQVQETAVDVLAHVEVIEASYHLVETTSKLLSS
ncbi:MAG: hypothetical protein OXF79_21905 [Chloroflexi bacterium]|nr:hypothetical protein [Chloroflexota bacterium]